MAIGNMVLNRLITILALITGFCLYGQNQIGETIYGEDTIDFSGYNSISGDGLVLAIGAHQNNGNNGADSGHVRIYSWDGSVWNKIGQDIDGEASGDESGLSVSLSYDGSIVAIGARKNDGNGNQAGHVRVYRWNESNSWWDKVGNDINGEEAEDNFGFSVS